MKPLTYRARNHLCETCGSSDLETQTRCKECALAVCDNARFRADVAKASNICYRCFHAEPSPGRSSCLTCQKKMREYSQRSRTKKKRAILVLVPR